MKEIREFKDIIGIPDDFLLFTPATRRELLCHYLKRLDDAGIDELSFQIAAPDHLLQAYNEDIPMTEDLFRAINRIAGTMHSAHITCTLAQRYGLTYCEDVSIPDSKEIKEMETFLKKYADRDLVEMLIKGDVDI